MGERIDQLHLHGDYQRDFVNKVASDLTCEGKIAFMLEVMGRVFQLKGTTSAETEGQ